MQDNDERLGTRHPIKPAVIGFPADKVTCRMQTFECDPFDLLGNAPYSNPPKSSPEKGEKSRREQQIFNCRKRWIFDDGSLENQWQLPKCLLDFECSLLRPLGECSMFWVPAGYQISIAKMPSRVKMRGGIIPVCWGISHVHQNKCCFCTGPGAKGVSSWWRTTVTSRVFSSTWPLALGTL